MTAQVAEKIIIDEEEFSLLAEPLTPLLEEKEVEFTSISSTCKRGYIGTWELKDNSLYLIAFDGVFDDERVELKDLYKNQSSDSVKAVWFSGKLRIPKGRIVEYDNGSYKSSYLEELEVLIDKGDIISSNHHKYQYKRVENLYSTLWENINTKVRYYMSTFSKLFEVE